MFARIKQWNSSRSRAIVIGLLAGCVMNIISFLMLVPLFKLAMPDCAPSQHDGQCVATFLTLVYSATSAGFIGLLTSLLITLASLR